MAHPAKMLKELKENKPNASIDHWIYGVFHTSRSDKVDGFKGLLAASEESLIFKSGGTGADSYVMEVPVDEVEEIEAELTGTVNMIIHLVDGGHMEMSYISRGNPREFLNFLKTRGESPKDKFPPIGNARK
ncbi:hypothetical protein M4S82_12395 [Planococcus sp. MERTA32b]|nr:hypothetical protein [Planococcus sp. MER TA 32b]